MTLLIYKNNLYFKFHKMEIKIYFKKVTILFDRISYTCLATADESMVPETEIKEGLKIQKILRKEY